MITLLLLTLTVEGRDTAQVQQDVPSGGAPGAIQLGDLPLTAERRTRVEEAIKSRNYSVAETILAEEIEKSPKSPQLLVLLGRIFFLDGKYLNCAVAFKRAEGVALLDDRDRFTLAMAYIILNHRDWARPELEKLARTNPQNALYPYWLSRLDYDAMQFSAAVARARKALELDPNFMKAYNNLGLCLEALGKYEEAIEIYQRAVRLNSPRSQPSPWPPHDLGALLVKLERFSEAETYLKQSLQYDPRFPRAHYQMGLLFEKQKKDSEAIDELQQAARLDPAYPEPHYLLGRIYQRRGDKKSAETEWGTFQKLREEEPKERPH